MHYLSANAFSRYFYGALVREERKYYIRKKKYFKELQVFQKYTQEYIISFQRTCPSVNRYNFLRANTYILIVHIPWYISYGPYDYSKDRLVSAALEWFCIHGCKYRPYYMVYYGLFPFIIDETPEHHRYILLMFKKELFYVGRPMSK